MEDVKKLLVVDDEPKIREVIREYAQVSDFEVDEAEDGMIAFELAKNNDYDIIIMDIMMPVKDGYTAAKEIREIKNTPIILLSARSEEYDKLFGFQLGIDDYVVKPFSPKELMARINAVVTRHRLTNPKTEQTAEKPVIAEKKETNFQFGTLIINQISHQVSIDGESIELTPKEFELLVYLAKNKNKALSREQLLEDVWGYKPAGEDRTIDTHIKNLRNHLGNYRDLIITLRGVGYKFTYEEN